MKRKYSFSVIIIIAILALAGFLRFWHLDSVPPGLYPDEAINGNDAIKALESGKYKVFYQNNNGREGLFINLISLVFKFFGYGIWQLRFISALSGLLTVLGIYLLTQELPFKNSKRVALLSAFFLSISFWHINFSRIAFRGILVPFCLTWSLYFLFKALNNFQKQRKKTALNYTNVIFFVLSSIFFGLGFYTYIAFRIAHLIFLPAFLWIVYYFWQEFKKNTTKWKLIYLKQNFWQVDIWFLTAILVLIPITIYFFHNPQDFMGRAGDVSVFNSEHPFSVLLDSTIKTLLMFNWHGDWNWRHNYSGLPQLFWPVGILFIIGFLALARDLIQEIREKEKNSYKIMVYLTLFLWFFTMLCPAIFTAEGLPHALRTIGVIPIVYLFAAFSAVNFYALFKKMSLIKRKIIKTFAACLLLGLIYHSFYAYFFDWARKKQTASAFSQNYVLIGNYLNHLPEQINKYVIINQGGVLVYPVAQAIGQASIKGLPMPAQTILFLEKTSQNQKKAKYLLPKDLEILKNTKPPSVFIPIDNNRTIKEKLENYFPDGRFEKINNIEVFIRPGELPSLGPPN